MCIIELIELAIDNNDKEKLQKLLEEWDNGWKNSKNKR
jgi:hypothetical protein